MSKSEEHYNHEIEAEKMDQRLTMPTALPTDYSLVPASVSGSLQPPAHPDPGESDDLLWFSQAQHSHVQAQRDTQAHT